MIYKLGMSMLFLPCYLVAKQCICAAQDQLAQQYAAAATLLKHEQEQEQQQQATVRAGVQTAVSLCSIQEEVSPDAMAVDRAQLTGPFSGSPSLPALSPADAGAWWLDDATLRFVARSNQLDEPLVLTVDAEPVTLSVDEVRELVWGL